MDSLSPSTLPVLALTNNTVESKFFVFAGTPESSVDANVGDICSDATNGDLYIKRASGTTGWKRLANTTYYSYHNPNTIGAGTTRYCAITGSEPDIGTESDTQIPMFAGVGTNFKLRISVNSTSSSSTATIRNNGVGTALTVTIGIGAVGVFSVTSAVTVASNDLMSLQFINGGGGGFTYVGYNLAFNPS